MPKYPNPSPYEAVRSRPQGVLHSGAANYEPDPRVALNGMRENESYEQWLARRRMIEALTGKRIPEPAPE